MESKEILDIKEFNGAGYEPLVDFNGWRVAILNYDSEKYDERKVNMMERHNRSDEVFMLSRGECFLLVGDGDDTPGNISRVKMEPGKLYDIKKGVWHNLYGSKDFKVFIVENTDTSALNSDYTSVSL